MKTLIVQHLHGRTIQVLSLGSLCSTALLIYNDEMHIESRSGKNLENTTRFILKKVDHNKPTSHSLEGVHTRQDLCVRKVGVLQKEKNREMPSRLTAYKLSKHPARLRVL